jgi:hypothetical protein
LNKYKRYSKDYRLAIVCLAIAVTAIVWVAAVGASLLASPASSSVLGLSREVATMTLFFVPTVTGVTVMLGLNFWYIAEGKSIGLYRIPDNARNLW